MRLATECKEEMVGPAPPTGWEAAGFPKSIICHSRIVAEVPNDAPANAPVHVRCARGHQFFVRVGDMWPTQHQPETTKGVEQ